MSKPVAKFALLLFVALVAVSSLRAQDLTGTWSWVSGQTLRIYSGGSFEVFHGNSRINQGRWVNLTGRQYRLTHNSGGWVDTVTVSADGNSLDGVNNHGYRLHGERQGRVSSIAGKWSWVSGQTLIIAADGSLEVWLNGRKVNEGRWESLGGQRYRFTHRSGGWVDTVTLSGDGNSLDGTNNHGYQLHGARQGAAPVSVATPSIAGTWNWVSGQTLIVSADGSLQVWLNGRQINEGRWESLGGQRYRLTHRSGGWVDTVSLSSDGRTLDGTNNAGSHIRGTRR